MSKTHKLLCCFITILFALAACAPPGAQVNDASAGSSSCTAAEPMPDNGLRVQFFDVGQADSTLVTLPDGRFVLIDGGNNADGPLLVDYLAGAGITRIDLLVATHPHEDHIGGLDDVIANLDIGAIYAPRLADSDVPTTKTYERFLHAVKDKGYHLTAPQPGELLLDGAVKLTCLAPNATGYGGANNYSIVLRLDYGAISFLFCGDAEQESEDEMRASGKPLRADVLKAGHHGSDTSTTEDFLREVSPAYAVISAGAGNSYGHPHQATLDRLTNAGAAVWRTDTDGTVTAASNGASVTFSADPSLCLDGNR